jgi:ABC-2 type transport system ATP-binding protein
MTVIQVNGVTKRFGATTAVDDLTFEVWPGRVTGFLGPNGAGKSTTLRMIVGLDRPDAGTVTVNGTPYGRHRRPLYEVGALLETGARHSGRSAYNHLLCLAQSNGIARRRVGEVLEIVGLSGVARRRAGGFSLGMGQRLGIAAALLGDPPVVICDEPVNGLDPEGILWIRGLLRGLAAEGRTVLVSSHLMSEMALTADHLIIIGRGRLIAEGNIAEIVAASATSHVLLRTPHPDRFAEMLRAEGARVESTGEPDTLRVHGVDCAAVGDRAAAHGLTVHELAPHNASLEAAYMELTRDSVDFAAAGSGVSAKTAADETSETSKNIQNAQTAAGVRL